MTKPSIRATRDDVVRAVGARAEFGDSVVIGDNGSYYWPTNRLDLDHVFAIARGGASHGLVVLVTRTGHVIRHGSVRVRIDFPRDTGDGVGTLVFGDDHIGGTALAAWFGRSA